VNPMPREISALPLSHWITPGSNSSLLPQPAVVHNSSNPETFVLSKKKNLAKKPRQPNLLFLWTDQHRADTVPWAGNSAVQAPALNSLAEQSFVFQRTYVTQPVCTPSRASILTGTWPHNHGAVTNHIHLRKELKTVADAVSDDYRTAYYGKWHLGNELRAQHGFKEWRSIDDSYWEDYTDPADTSKFSDYYKFLTSRGFPPDDVEENPGQAVFSRELAAALPERYTKVNFIADEAETFLQERKDGKPFVLVVSALEPHPPNYGPLNESYQPEEMPAGPSFAKPLEDSASILHRKTYERLREKGFKNHPMETEDDFRRLKANYYGLVTMVDNAYGRVLKALEDSGQADNTIIVYTSDHGEMMGDHGLMGKSVFYEESTRVPLTIRVPWLSREQKNIKGLFSQVDLLPTLLDLMGADTPSTVEGESKATQMNDDSDMGAKFVVIEWNSPAYPDEVGRSLVSEDGWKLNQYGSDNPELFNLNKDPGELHNLALDRGFRDRLNDLKKELAAWQQRTGDKLVLLV
ncbi:MAG: sulfatase-like hydrolase/transferase, partial [Verrucomicrobia bacterium]|nr:sulfatase-like hydrolase/transferase [Verrucomicrobiota bacterium]